MPLYEYECEICGQVVEKVFKVANKPDHFEDECPSCKGMSPFKSKISAPAVMYSVFNPSAKMPSEFKNRMEQIRKNNPSMESKYA